MRQGVYLFLFLLTNLQLFSQTTITSKDNGDWNNTATWNLDRIPNASDNVLIQHDVEVIDGPYTVNRIEINNEPGVNSKLKLNSAFKFEVSTNLIINSTGTGGNVDLEIINEKKVTVSGNVVINRLSSNSSGNRTELKIRDDAFLKVDGNLVYNYAGIGSEENHHDMRLQEKSRLIIGGNFEINASSSKDFEMHLFDESKITCQGQFNMNVTEARATVVKINAGTTFEVNEIASINNTSEGKYDINFYVSGILDFKKDISLNSFRDDAQININVDGASSEFWARGDLKIDGGSEQDVMLNLIDNAKLYIGGNLSRVDGFGHLNMSDNSNWIYNGGDMQVVSCTEGTGLDKMNFTNIVFENTGTEMIMEGDLMIEKELVLTNGVIKSTDAAMLILADGATVIASSDDTYVEGPIKKISTTNLTDFTFPLGAEGRYAPMTISSAAGRAATGGEYIAQYYNCPPPWEVDQNSNVQQISDEEFWTLSRSNSTDPVNITLHWSDAAAQGITNTGSLVVAMYNDPITGSSMFPYGVTSIGNGGITENGISGSISNITTCPPPWEVDQFTFGSTDGRNALPVMMNAFGAKLNGLKVDIDWRSSAEVNSSHYSLEKSIDGVNFYEIDRVNSRGTDSDEAWYRSVDTNPTIGINYYRIIQVDLDGMSAATDIVSVKYNEEASLTIYPNPIQDNFVLKGEILNKATSFKISDNMGRVIYVSPVSVKEGLLDLNSSILNIEMPGLYFIEIDTGGQVATWRILKS